ncbi:MAG: DUF4239 domain-containing protein [Candidatus Obscuribacterales bacterium]|nr:DUF4239 domain-containing protein [Candidatus Obscuribacterales bacterium]
MTDPYSQFVGMLFAVLLGFMVADAMQRFGTARQTVEQEASALASVFRLADGLSDEGKNKLQRLCLNYAEEVIHVEWPLLAKKETSMQTWETYRKLWRGCTEYDPETPRQVAAHSALLPCMATLGECRRLRVDALHNGLHPVLWCSLIIGGVATILFTYFFNVENIRIQAVMVSIVSLVICLNIFLLFSYDDPFSGEVMINPTAFETQLQLFQLEMEPAKVKAIR